MAKISFDINNKLVGAAVFAVIVIVLQLVTLQQISSSSDVTRTITATGSATIEAQPNEFRFSPYFEFTNADSDSLKDAMATKGNEVVDGLKALGVADSDIKLDASQYDYYYFDKDEDTQRGQVSITVTLSDKDLAQKVQDFLNNQGAEGQISPRATFSDAKQKELQKQAEELATVEAKENAERLANGLGAKVGKVIKINPQSDFRYPEIYALDSTTSEGSSNQTLPIQTGENEYTYTISVEFELK